MDDKYTFNTASYIHVLMSSSNNVPRWNGSVDMHLRYSITIKEGLSYMLNVMIIKLYATLKLELVNLRLIYVL